MRDLGIFPIVTPGPLGRIGYGFIGDNDDVDAIFGHGKTSNINNLSPQGQLFELQMLRDMQANLWPFLGMEIETLIRYKLTQSNTATVRWTGRLENINIESIFVRLNTGIIIWFAGQAQPKADRFLGYGLTMDVGLPKLPQNGNYRIQNLQDGSVGSNLPLIFGNQDPLLETDVTADGLANTTFSAILPDEDPGQIEITEYIFNPRVDTQTPSSYGVATTSIGGANVTEPARQPAIAGIGSAPGQVAAGEGAGWVGQTIVNPFPAHITSVPPIVPSARLINGIVTGYDFDESPNAQVFDIAGEDWYLQTAVQIDSKRWAVTLYRPTPRLHTVLDSAGYGD